jgi:hypothetical protein
MLYECTRAQRRERLGFLLCFQIEGRTPQDPTSQGWDGWLIVTSMEMIWHVFLWLVDGWWYEINLYNDHDMIIIYIYLWKSVKHVFSKTSWDLDLGPCSQTQRQGTVRSRSLVSQLIVWCKKRTVYGGMIEKNINNILQIINYYRQL